MVVVASNYSLKLTPQRIGLLWEVFVRNYYIREGYAAFRVSGSGPPCDVIAFQPPANFNEDFPKRLIARKRYLESQARKQYRGRFGYLDDLIPSVLEGFYYEKGQLKSLQAQLIAFKRDHMRFIWTRGKTKKRPARTWDKVYTDIHNLEFVECKAVALFDITKFRQTKQFHRQMQYCAEASAQYITIHKTDKGAMRFIHLPDKSIAVGFIIEWNEILGR